MFSFWCVKHGSNMAINYINLGPTPPSHPVTDDSWRLRNFRKIVTRTVESSEEPVDIIASTWAMEI